MAQWAERHHCRLWPESFKTTHIFIIVILFGAATDYCLFLIARYREELEHGLEPARRLEEALGQTGHALTASAMTTILGLGAMVFADFGKYRSGGPTIAMSLVVALVACMTIAPALLRALGRWLLWEIRLRWIVLVPGLDMHQLPLVHCGSEYRTTSSQVLRFALPNLAVIVGCVLLWATAAQSTDCFSAIRKGAGASDSD